LQRLEPQFHEAGLTLRWQGALDVAWIDADGRRMEQVIDNLLVNTLRYVPRGGAVSVDLVAARGDDHARYRLTVTDDGPGFPEADLPHVFDRFYRGSRQHEADGTGLGLAIVQEIVRRHGGRVWAENRDPQGAAVHVELPVAAEGR
jgi:signal transduction histidine kinase